jgi:hypothetical protein
LAKACRKLGLLGFIRLRTIHCMDDSRDPANVRISVHPPEEE